LYAPGTVAPAVVAAKDPTRALTNAQPASIVNPSFVPEALDSATVPSGVASAFTPSLLASMMVVDPTVAPTLVPVCTTWNVSFAIFGCTLYQFPVDWAVVLRMFCGPGVFRV